MTKAHTFTNEIKLSIDIYALTERYDFYEIVVPKLKNASAYADFYRSIRQNLSPDGVCVYHASSKRYIVALKKPKTLPRNDFHIKRLHRMDLRRIPKKNLFTLLLSLMAGEEAYFQPASSPYALYYIHTVSRQKIIALKLDIKQQSSRLFFNLAVATFIKTSPLPRCGKTYYVLKYGKLQEYDPQRDTHASVYEKGTYAHTKTLVPFMDIGGKSFEKTKVYFLRRIYQDIRMFLADYVQLSFLSRSVSIYADTNDSEKKRTLMKHSIFQKLQKSCPEIPIVTASRTIPYAMKLQTQMNKLCTQTTTFPVVSHLPPTATCAITVTEPADYYEQTRHDDPYRFFADNTTIPLQNVTTQTELSSSVATVILKELLIKSELMGNIPFTNHPEHIEGVRYVAIIDAKENVFFQAKLQHGRLVASALDDSEQLMCEEILYYVPQGEEAEYIVITPSSVMLTTKTLLYPLPDFERLYQKYRDATRKRFIPLASILALLDDSKETERIEAIRRIETPQGVPSDKLAAVTDRRFLSKLQTFLGIPLKYTARDKTSKSLYQGLLGISFFYENDTVLYRSGLSSGNIREVVKRNSPYRRIIPIEGKINLETILPLLESYFVKYGELTVMPYPVKYAKEGFAIAHR